jgi:hypothetical protein
MYNTCRRMTVLQFIAADAIIRRNHVGMYLPVAHGNDSSGPSHQYSSCHAQFVLLSYRARSTVFDDDECFLLD